MMTYKDGVGVDLDAHADILFKLEHGCCTSIMDKDVADQTEVKTAAAWHSSKKNYEEHHALLLAHTENRSGMMPPSADRFVFSSVVVWVAHWQSLYHVPDAIIWMKKRGIKGEESMALCRIPKDHHPYWPYPLADDPHLLVYNEEEATGEPTSFSALCLLTAKNNDREPCVVLNRCMSGHNVRSDKFVLIPTQLRGAVWSNEVYQVYDNDGGSAPAFNPLYFKGSEIIPKPAIMYNPTLGSAAMAAAVTADGAPAPFVPNDGITLVPPAGGEMPGDGHQPMDVSSQEFDGGNASDTMASTAPLHPGGPDHSYPTLAPLDHGDWNVSGDASTTTHMPASTATPAPMTTPLTTPTPQLTQGQTIPIYQGTGFIPSAVASAAQQLQLNMAWTNWINMMTPKVYGLLKPMKGLAQWYRELVQNYTDSVQVINAQALLDLNTCALSIRTTIGEWRIDVEQAIDHLGGSPGILAYNNQANLVRQKTVILQ